MQSPRAPVTVVIPCFNSGATVYRAALSAWSQTWPPEEVVIVDDGSGDPTTLEVLAGMEVLFGDRLTVVYSHDNGGPAAARNRGWQHSTQPFVAFLDADDAWHHQKLELQLAVMLTDPRPAISGHPFAVFPAIGGPDETRLSPAPRDVSYRRALFLNPFSTPSVIVRSDIGERFDPSKRYSEDYDLWLRILRSHGIGKTLPIPLCILFKPPVGDTGLSAQLLNMEAGQTRVFRDLHKAGHIPWPTYIAVRTWATIRFVRRLTMVSIRRLGRRRAR